MTNHTADEMKVLFVGFGITPYFRDFLNRLQSQGGIEVTNVRPIGENRNLGAGVHQDFSGMDFRDIQLPPLVLPARRWLGVSDWESAPQCTSFQGLSKLIMEDQPDVIVVNVNYHYCMKFDKGVRTALRQAGSRVVFHSIPFQQATLEEATAAVTVPKQLPLRSLPGIARRLVTGLQLDRAYLTLIRRRALLRRVQFQKFVFNSADMHAVYFEGGVDVYGSWGVPPERIRIVRNSPNTEALLAAAERHPAVDSGFRLIHVGRLVEWKRVDLLIRCVATLRRTGFPETELAIVGYGPCEEELRSLADELGIADAVQFRGGVYEPDELAREFAAASIYVLAGMGGLSINEAMCFALPIICSRCDGTETFLVREGKNGLYFREGDEESLVQAIRRLLSDPKMRRRLGEESLRIIREELNTQIHVANYLKMFSDLTGKSLNA
ncbi:MAG: glycosyltransferase family 4 protein [Planctomycetaceae bacterium]|nr:glycosyltransferase family 4 protein [Planctomycetaceae bacterium]